MLTKKSKKAKPKHSAKSSARKEAPARATKAGRSDQFRGVFQAIHGILETLAPQLSVVADKPDNYYLNTASPSWKGKPLFFAALQLKKNYVSYHLFPVYTNPRLLTTISPALKKHMQGKACFNFTEVDLILFTELAVLTIAGFREYEKKGLL
jgi:hypothetical protein